MPEIKRIKKDHRAPKAIKKAKSIKHIQQMSEHRKQENRIAHTKPENIQMKAERKKVIIKELT